MKNFINFILKKIKKNSIKSQYQKNLQKKIMSKASGKTSKRIITSNDSLLIDSKEISIKDEINAEAKTILKEAIDKPEILVNFIKSKGGRVIKSKYMKFILFLVGEQTGFLPPLKGFKAFSLNILLNILTPAKLRLKLTTPALFALDDKPVNIYLLSHQFHLWLSYVNELPGFDHQTRNNFKTIWDSNVDSIEIKNLSIEEILSLKDAIARDTEALKFVKEMTREFVGQKQSLQKIKQGGSANI